MKPRFTALDYWDAKTRFCDYCAAATFNKHLCDYCTQKRRHDD